jgi:hypothetical protein
MLIDFDHGIVETERPIRLQDIYKATCASATTAGSATAPCAAPPSATRPIVGTSTVITKNVPANAVVAGAPGRILRMRSEPDGPRWE